MNRKTYQDYINILREELVPAMGCTEPIALAYAAALARETLGGLPDRILAQVSGSIIKNVKSVIVPNTNHMRGIPAAIAVGVVAGKSERQLEVISEITGEQLDQIDAFLHIVPIEVQHTEDGPMFNIMLTLFRGESCTKIHIADYHTNVVLLEKDGTALLHKEMGYGEEEGLTDRSVLSIEGIWEFITTMDVNDVRDILQRQIDYNTAISDEGLRGNYGASIGKLLLNDYGSDIKVRAKARAAAGSDARMNGCKLPVIINSGSGNQGMTASLPVIEYARELGADEDKLMRALALSNLATIHQKTPIGRLSAFCGAVSAGAGAGAGIAYLCGGDYQAVIHTIVNALAIVSGMVCDGAKASCAAKIAAAVDAGILGYCMYTRDQQFYGGDGLVKKSVEATISSIGHLGKDGMRETNEEIIKIMLSADEKENHGVQ